MHFGIERAQTLDSNVLLDLDVTTYASASKAAQTTHLLKHVELGDVVPDVALWLKHRDDDDLGFHDIV